MKKPGSIGTLILKGVVFLLIVCSLSGFEVKAQLMFIDEKKEAAFAYEETPVRIIVEGYRGFYIYVLYTNSDLVYVGVEDLFKTLKIPCIAGQRGDSLSGFIEKESRTYLIDYPSKQVQVGDKLFNFNKGLIKEMNNVYMESSLFAEAFGIHLAFNFRSQSIKLKSDFELPLIKQQRIEKIRSNILKIKGEPVADTSIQRKYNLFKPGMIDWSLASFQTWREPTGIFFSLGIGTEFLFGEADLSVYYSNYEKFDPRYQLNYQWRWVDNSKKIIKQARVGKISVPAISFLNAPLVGAAVSNSSTIVRKATGYYIINEITEPNWTVELYINDILIGYTKADASGLFVFKVPIVYGYTTVKLKFYGPMGEERTEERTRNVPYTVMASGEFGYGLSAGYLLNNSSSRFGHAEIYWGVTRFLTVGGGLEYLSSIPNGPFIPFAKLTLQPLSKLMLNVEYDHGVKSRFLLDYYFFRDALLEIDYTRYVKGQLATIFSAPEERKVKISLPFKIKKINGYVKMDFTQLVYTSFNFNQANMMVSAHYNRFSVNSDNHINWNNLNNRYFTSDLAFSYTLNKGFTIRAMAQYNVSENRLMRCNLTIEKRIPKGYLTVTYERNVLSNDNYINMTFRYELPFARTGISASHSSGNPSFYESAQGSLAFGGGNNYIHSSNNSSTGKGGLLLYPFLDLNRNGIFDRGEPMVKLTSLRINGGRTMYSEKDSIIRIADLNAFVSYTVIFSNYDLGNIAWQFKYSTYSLLIDPNHFKRVDIPVIVLGDVSGMAYIAKDTLMKGIGRILVKFYSKNSDKVVAETLSESDGYIDYIGLAPGDYVARIDSAQLSTLGLIAEPPQRDFTIKTMEQGDIVQGIDFVLRPEAKKP